MEENKFSISKMIKDEKVKVLSNDFILDKKELGFYLPGTEVKQMKEGNIRINAENYYICKVTFSQSERLPYYSLRKFYCDDDNHSVLQSHYFTEVSESNLTFAKPLHKSKIKIVDIPNDSDTMVGNINGEFFNRMKAHLCLGTYVTLKTDTRNLKNKERKITHISIDSDLNVFYHLDNNTSKHYIANDLICCYDKVNTKAISIELFPGGN